MKSERARPISQGETREGPVVYWMRRDQRVRDNWALIHAQQLARERQAPLAILFCLVPRYLGAGRRHYGFMLAGLQQVAADLAKLDVPFFLLAGEPRQVVPEFVAKHQVAVLVTDFSPLRLAGRWNAAVAKRIDIPFVEVDAHNVVPCWVASDKQEYAARTIRPKIHKRLADYLDPLPRLRKHSPRWPGRRPACAWRQVDRTLRISASVTEVDWLEPGEKAARKVLRDFVARRLRLYEPGRNDPNVRAQSLLSPYLHFGQISAQRVALEVLKWDRDVASREAFLEELIVRRELADNFCHYNENYDSVDGFPDWARKSLAEHAGDRRPYEYTRHRFEKARTHDELWNACQMEMVITGKMHGYLRMYWAKKILEWTGSADEAMRIAIYLNDKYELDGRDPNGYTGVAWSIGGVHDRPWFERPIFGKIRYMSEAGCRRKFDVPGYVRRIDQLRAEADR